MDVDLYLLSFYSPISAIVPIALTQENVLFSDRLKIEYVGLRGSILGPLTFNVNLIDMLYECEDFNIENYADDITPYARAADNTVISELQTTASKLFIWLGDNHMKANPEKGHLLLSSKTPKKAYFGEALGELISTEKLL